MYATIIIIANLYLGPVGLHALSEGQAISGCAVL
jgi:hypothetical protein